MLEVIWFMAGGVLIAVLALMVGCVMGMGEWKAGLEVWAEIVMQVTTFGRWKPTQEEAE